MSLQQHTLNEPVACQVCGQRSFVLVQEYEATKVHDPMCRACFEAQDVKALRQRRRKREVVRSGKRFVLRRRPKDEVLEPECLN